MKEKEPLLTRREALKLGLLYGAVGLAAGINVIQQKDVVGGFLRGLLDSPPQNPPEPLRELENYIVVPQEGEWARRARVNKAAFATAFTLIALRQDPETGFSRLREFMFKYPLKIEFADENRVEAGLRGQLLGKYLFLGKGGPTIRFYPVFMTSYQAAQKGNDTNLLKHLDTILVHEGGHFWQDYTHPGRFYAREMISFSIESVRTLPCTVSLGYLGEFPNIPQYDHDSDPLEIEADEIAQTLIDSHIGDITNSQEFPWPFGRFFEFT